MANKAMLKQIEDSYRGFTREEREAIARQVNGRNARNDEERALYERYRNHQPNNG